MEFNHPIKMTVDEISLSKTGTEIVLRKDNGPSNSDTVLWFNEVDTAKYGQQLSLGDEVEVTLTWNK